MWWIYPVYLIDLGAMVFLAFALGDLVDLLDKKTKLSGAFLGGVLLAVVTSLPELFTSLSSVFVVNEPEFVVGDIFGSIIFNLVVLMLETLLFLKRLRECKIKKFHLWNALLCLAMYGFSAYAFFAPKQWQLMLGDINAMSVVIFALYVLSLFLQPKEKGEESLKEESKNPWSVKKTGLFFLLCSLGLIGTSIALTYLTKLIQIELPFLSGSVAGALLLGIGTSIPEVVSTVQLLRKKNADAAIGNMVGSCTFDFAIFAFSDFLSWRAWNNAPSSSGGYLISERGLFIDSLDAMQLEIGGAIVCALAALFLAYWIFSPSFGKKKGLCFAITGAISVLCLAVYLAVFVF